MLTPDYIDSTTANLYSELLQQLVASEAARGLSDLRGTFVKKNVKGATYWYLQYLEAGRQKQAYLGPDSKELSAFLLAHEQGKAQKAEDAVVRKRLCSLLTTAGAVVPDPLQGRILRILADSGVFRTGGILVGSHAFFAYANMLSVRWPGAHRTQDVDVAYDTVSVAMQRETDQSHSDLPDILKRAEMGFHPIPELNPKHPSTSFKIRGKDVRVDFLTPLVGKSSRGPVLLPSLKTAAQPLRFLDYLMESTVPAAIVYGDGLLVHVPDPARFALHKLVIAGERPVSEQAKARKDVAQAEMLLSVLLRDREDDVMRAKADLVQRGPGWRARLAKGMKKIGDDHIRKAAAV